MTQLTSALYEGPVLHRRVKPQAHRLSYRVFSLLIDLDELDALRGRFRLLGIDRPGLISFHQRDHGDGKTPLRPWIEARLAEAGIEGSPFRIRMLAYPRVFGHVFNPLTVWYCDHGDGRPAAILYEVNNTFGQRHIYLLPVSDGASDPIRQSCEKGFYVSPFLPMDMTYNFSVVRPDSGRLSVAIRETDAAGDDVLHASFTGKARPLSDRGILATLLRHPALGLKVVGGIHWEALKLWRKGAAFHKRPAPPERLVTIHHAASRTLPHDLLNA